MTILLVVGIIVVGVLFIVWDYRCAKREEPPWFTRWRRQRENED